MHSQSSMKVKKIASLCRWADIIISLTMNITTELLAITCILHHCEFYSYDVLFASAESLHPKEAGCFITFQKL